jgi:hypothetical protein
MRHLIKLAALPLGAALFLLSCAPVDDPPARVTAPAPTATGEPAPEPAPLPPVPEGLKERVETALKHVRQRDLLTTHAFWTIFHGILGMGPDTTLLDPATKQRVNAVDFVRTGGAIRGLEFIPTRDGLDVRTGPQFVGQGHQDQFIAEMAQWGMPIDTKFLVYGKEYTFADFVRHAQMRARVTANQELSWAILIVGQYIGTDVSWTNSFGEKLTFEDVVRYELDQPVEAAACGGTHRLFGLTWVYHLHLRKGGRPTGVWKDVADKIALYEKKAKQWQNPDGSFSTKYLAGPGNAHDVMLRIGTTGHVLEWLALALPDAELRAPWMQEAASALSLIILDCAGRPADGGGLYHATHGLQIYHDRVFGPDPSAGRHTLIPLPPERLPPPAVKERDKP